MDRRNDYQCFECGKFYKVYEEAIECCGSSWVKEIKCVTCEEPPYLCNCTRKEG